MSVSNNKVRISITINKRLNDTIDAFIENCGDVIQIPSKSYLFQMAVVEWFNKLDESLEKEKKGE